MAQKQVKGRRSYKEDRRLLGLAVKSNSLEAIAGRLKRPPATALKMATRLGDSIKSRGYMKV